MKRNEAFQQLSHDHHDGLVFAAEIRKARAAGDSLEALAARVATFWENHLAEHFALEEETLLPVMRDGRRAELSSRLVSEHEAIRKLVGSLQDADRREAALDAFSDVLISHIRFEERELFPELERTLSANELARISSELTSRGDADHG